MHVHFSQLSAISRENVVSVSIAADFQLILSMAIIVVEERFSLVDLYNGTRDGSIELRPPAATLSSLLKPSKSNHSLRSFCK